MRASRRFVSRAGVRRPRSLSLWSRRELLDNPLTTSEAPSKFTSTVPLQTPSQEAAANDTQLRKRRLGSPYDYGRIDRTRVREVRYNPAFGAFTDHKQQSCPTSERAARDLFEAVTLAHNANHDESAMMKNIGPAFEDLGLPMQVNKRNRVQGSQPDFAFYVQGGLTPRLLAEIKGPSANTHADIQNDTAFALALLARLAPSNDPTTEPIRHESSIPTQISQLACTLHGVVRTVTLADHSAFLPHSDQLR